MDTTLNRMQTYWPESREFIKKNWPQFTDVELDRINGNYDCFLTYLKEFYNGFPLLEAKARQLLQEFHNELDERLFQKK